MEVVQHFRMKLAWVVAGEEGHHHSWGLEGARQNLEPWVAVAAAVGKGHHRKQEHMVAEFLHHQEESVGACGWLSWQVVRGEEQHWDW